jgi:hypothetical protein
MQGTSILLAELTPPAGQEARFHAWYDEEHIPERVALPGVLSAQRYRHSGQAATGFMTVAKGGASLSQAPPSYMALYELADLSVLRDPGYAALKASPSAVTREMLAGSTDAARYAGDEIAMRRQAGAGLAALDAPLLYAVWFRVPQAGMRDFDAWYEQDHIPLLMDCPEWLMARRFAIPDAAPGGFTRLALHWLADRSALDSPARYKARGTPWRARLAAEPWFVGTYKVFERFGARQPGRNSPAPGQASGCARASGGG